MTPKRLAIRFGEGRTVWDFLRHIPREARRDIITALRQIQVDPGGAGSEPIQPLAAGTTICPACGGRLATLNDLGWTSSVATEHSNQFVDCKECDRTYVIPLQ